jgi:ferredoxin
MANMITEECIACGACEDECPNDAISLKEEIFVIDPALCSECVGFYESEKCTEACPVGACVPDPNIRESEEALFVRARQIHGAEEPLELSGETSHFRAA